MAHTVWHSENMEIMLEEEITPEFIQRPKLSKNMPFSANADIYMDKKVW